MGMRPTILRNFKVQNLKLYGTDIMIDDRIRETQCRDLKQISLYMRMEQIMKEALQSSGRTSWLTQEMVQQLASLYCEDNRFNYSLHSIYSHTNMNFRQREESESTHR